MEIVLDTARCSGHARCHEMASEVYDLDDLGFAVVTQPQVPVELEAAARTGARACPERAITLH